MLTVRDFLMPDLGEGLTEGEINRWLVAEGDVVVVDQPVAEITTEKAVVEVPTPFAGRVATLHGAEGETITVGKPLISIEVAGAPNAGGASGNVLVGYGTSEVPPRSRRSAPPQRPGGPATVVNAAMPPASPLVRRRAIELGIDLSTITGSGPGGMVTQADLERASRQDGATPEMEDPATVAVGDRVALTGVDRIAAERLTRSHRDAPTATALVRADATRLMELRAELAPGVDGCLGDTLRHHLAALRDRAPEISQAQCAFRHSDERGGALQADPPRGRRADRSRPRGRGDSRRPEQVVARDRRRPPAACRAPLETGPSTRPISAAAPSRSPTSAPSVSTGARRSSIPPRRRSSASDGSRRAPGSSTDEVVPRSVVELSLVFDHRVADGGVAGGFIRHLADLDRST